MKGQLSLEFLSALVIIVIYLAAVFGLFRSMAETLDGGVQKIQVDELAKEIEFWAKVHKGDMATETFELDLFPTTRLAILSEGGFTVIKSCSTATSSVYQRRIDGVSLVSASLGAGECDSYPLRSESSVTVLRSDGKLRLD